MKMRLGLAMWAILVIITAVALDRLDKNLYLGSWLFRIKNISLFKRYVEFILHFCAHTTNLSSSKLATAIMVVLPLLLVVCMELCSWLLLGIFGKILLATLVLYYCLGNANNVEHDSPFIIAHEQAFGILFWFVLLGTFGVCLYWILITSCDESLLYNHSKYRDKILQHVRWLHALAAWIPARITGFIYALVGDFSAGYKRWHGCMSLTSMHSSQVLLECGLAANGGTEQAEELVIVDRAFVAWVILCILIILVK